MQRAAAEAPRGARADTATPGDQRRGSRAHLRSRLYGRELSDACPTRRADRTDLSWRGHAADTKATRPHAEMSKLSARISMRETEYSPTLCRPCRRSARGLSRCSSRKSDRRFRAACDGPLGRDQAPQNCLICTVSDTEASVSVEHLSTTLAAICGYLACCRPPSRSANLLSDRGGRLADALGCSA